MTNSQLKMLEQLREVAVMARHMSIDSSNLKFNEKGSANKARAKAIHNMMRETKVTYIQCIFCGFYARSCSTLVRV